jgi:hypothetical protein
MAKFTQRSFFVKYYSIAFSTLPGIAGGLARELLRILPNFNLDGYSSIYGYRNPVHMERILVNLRKAGLPGKPPLRHEE